MPTVIMVYSLWPHLYERRNYRSNLGGEDKVNSSQQWKILDSELSTQTTASLIDSPRLASVINCNTRHAGQIEYLRGLVKYGGWFPGAEKRSGSGT